MHHLVIFLLTTSASLVLFGILLFILYWNRLFLLQAINTLFTSFPLNSVLIEGRMIKKNNTTLTDSATVMSEGGDVGLNTAIGDRTERGYDGNNSGRKGCENVNRVEQFFK